MIRYWIAAALVAMLAGSTRSQSPVEDPVADPISISDTKARARSLNEQGAKAYEAGQYAEAVTYFEQAHQADPADATIGKNFARALHARSRDLAKGGNLQQAISDLQRAMALDKVEVAFPLRLAEIWRERDDFDQARRILEQALEAHPKDARLFEALGRLAYDEEQLERALELLEAAARLDPERAKSWKTFLEKVRREAEVEKGYFSDVKGSFTVKYDDRNFRDVGQAVLTLLDRTHHRLGIDLGHWPGRRITVVLYTRGDYDVATGAHAWTGGLFDGKIRLPVRNYSRVAREIEATLAHELTHLFVRSMTSRCPLWLNEGLAQYQEGRRSAQSARRKVRDAMALDELSRFKSLPSSWAGIKDAERVTLYYAQSIAFTEFLIERYGWHSLSGLLQTLDAAPSFASAFERAFGAGLDEVEDSWRATLH